MKQYNTIFRNLDNGVILRVKAAGGDDRREAREGAYRKAGFSDPDGDDMYGRVKNGKMVPTNYPNFKKYLESDRATFEKLL